MLISEKLNEMHSVIISRKTIRKGMMYKELWKAKTAYTPVNRKTDKIG